MENGSGAPWAVSFRFLYQILMKNQWKMVLEPQRQNKLIFSRKNNDSRTPEAENQFFIRKTNDSRAPGAEKTNFSLEKPMIL